MAEAVGTFVVILLRLAFLTVALAGALEVWLRMARRGTLGRDRPPALPGLVATDLAVRA